MWSASSWSTVVVPPAKPVPVTRLGSIGSIAVTSTTDAPLATTFNPSVAAFVPASDPSVHTMISSAIPAAWHTHERPGARRSLRGSDRYPSQCAPRPGRQVERFIGHTQTREQCVEQPTLLVRAQAGDVDPDRADAGAEGPDQVVVPLVVPDEVDGLDRDRVEPGP